MVPIDDLILERSIIEDSDPLNKQLMFNFLPSYLRFKFNRNFIVSNIEHVYKYICFHYEQVKWDLTLSLGDMRVRNIWNHYVAYNPIVL